jgi:hypothetical protein
LGTTNSERNNLVIKVLVLTGHTRISLNNDDESLLSEFGKFKKEDKKVLRIQTESADCRTQVIQQHSWSQMWKIGRSS